jgi:hypothetical protein
MPEKPVGQLSPAEIEYWVAQFADDQLKLPSSNKASNASFTLFESEPLNPFPPGYAEDLLDEFDELP